MTTNDTRDMDPRQIDLIDYIEDAENAGPPALEKTLSDEELESAGLVGVKAFIRSNVSKNAERVRKAAERRERGENGPPRKQLNLQAPVQEEARNVIKELNSALLDQVLTPDDIREALREGANWKQRATNAERERDQLRQQIEKLTSDLSSAKRRYRWLGWPLSSFLKGKSD